MAHKEYLVNEDQLPKTAKSVTENIYEAVGTSFPVRLRMANGEVVSLSFETEWKEGGTTAVKEYGEIRYEEDYTEKKLTAAQISKLKQWISSNTKLVVE